MFPHFLSSLKCAVNLDSVNTTGTVIYTHALTLTHINTLWYIHIDTQAQNGAMNTNLDMMP